MGRCCKLKEYAHFVARVREDLESGMSLRDAANEAIEYCIQEAYEEGREEGREVGRKEGREEGRENGITERIANAVLELLKDLDAASDSLRDMILKQRDPEILNKWLKFASRSESIEMFKARIEELDRKATEIIRRNE